MNKKRLLKVDLHDKTKHNWSKCHRDVSQLWSIGYHIQSELTGLNILLNVYGESKKQCEERDDYQDKFNVCRRIVEEGGIQHWKSTGDYSEVWEK